LTRLTKRSLAPAQVPARLLPRLGTDQRAGEGQEIGSRRGKAQAYPLPAVGVMCALLAQ